MNSFVSALLLSLFLFQPAAAADGNKKTFLTLPLGEPFSIPDCMHDKAKTTACYWAPNGYMQSLGANKGPLKTYSVSIPPKLKPSLFLASDTWIDVRNGRITSVRTSTLGIIVQDRIFDLLVEKYGPPAYRGSVALTTLMGVSSEAILATWKTQGLRIEFYGATTSIDRGEIVVMTDDEAAVQKAGKAAKEEAEPSL